MHLLETAATQPGFGNQLGKHRARTPFYCRAVALSSSSLRPFFCGNEKGFFSAWKLFGVGKDSNFNSGKGHDGHCSAKLLVKAVTTLEHKRLVYENNNGERLGLGNSRLVVDNVKSASVQRPFLNRDWEGLDEKEILRRTRISKANKGIVPWNKGKKHRPETVERIRERTRLAMQDPKVKMKLVNLGHAQSPETRIKIGVSVRIGWQRRRKKLHLQETCHFKWQNLIAEAARKGFDGEAALQWDSYETVKEKLEEEWLESIEIRKTTLRAKGSKRAPKSFDQRRKISEAISRKWAEAEYRDRVLSALAKYHGIEPGVERKPRKRPSDNSRGSSVKKDATGGGNRSSRTVTKSQTPRPKLSKRKAPLYKDPLASSKLEMIKSIRAQRASVETKKTEAIERAKLLIAEAERAAEALEAAAAKSPIARASLIETRKLIAEAVRSIESIETYQPSSSNENNSKDARVSETDVGREVPTEAITVKVNGTRLLEPASKGDDDIGFTDSKSNLRDVLDFDGGLFPMSSTGSQFSYETLKKQSDSVSLTPDGQTQENLVANGAARVEVPEEEVSNDVGTLTEQATVSAVAVTKRWVRGRLVEVAEGEV